MISPVTVMADSPPPVSARPPTSAPIAIPAFSAEAGSDAARSPPGPARAVTRYCTDGTAAKPARPHTPSTTAAGTGRDPTKASTPSAAARTSPQTTMVSVAFQSASLPPRKVPSALAIPNTRRKTLTIPPAMPVTSPR